ncbi:MAG: hypothetical protein H6739_09985 [Alphaproteobacteria bacterium]|nr:hypothetical protein [Alphaproteobacteria bacterium]
MGFTVALSACGTPAWVADAPAPVLAALGCPESPDLLDFEPLFAYGERCGELLGARAFSERGAAVPASHQPVFYDGVSHGMRQPPADLDAWLAQVRSTPTHLQPFMHEAAIRAWTMQADGEPDLVVPWVADYVEKAGIADGFNGVRVGLQQSRGDDLAEALDLAARYPADWWPPLYEELGWRVGDRLWRDGPDPETLLPHVPEEARCAYVQGTLRGLTLRHISDGQTEWSAVEAVAQRIGGDCACAAWYGVGWAVALTSGRDSGRAEHTLDGIADLDGREHARDASRWALSGGNAPWSRPSKGPRQR